MSVVKCPNCGSTNVIKLDEKTKKEILNEILQKDGNEVTLSPIASSFLRTLAPGFRGGGIGFKDKKIRRKIEKEIKSLEYLCLDCKKPFVEKEEEYRIEEEIEERETEIDIPEIPKIPKLPFPRPGGRGFPGGGLPGGGCYITTATFKALKTQNDKCEELELFRWYRDNILAKEADGKKLIEEYYQTAPLIVEKINSQPNAKEIYHNLWENYLKPCLEHLKRGEYQKVKILYVQMVRDLQKEFLNRKGNTI